MRTLFVLAAVSVGVAVAQPVPTTVYISLGEKAEAVEPWDGSLRVSGGELLRLEERHFMGSDELSGPNSWKASTRQEQIRGFPRVNYNEMSPAELPPTQYSPIGLFAVVRGDGSTNLSVRTRQGDFEFRLADVSNGTRAFLDGRARASVTPTVERLSNDEFEDDEAAAVRLSGSAVAVAWVAYKNEGDRVMLRIGRNNSWEESREVTPAPGDIWRASAAADGEGRLWVFWSQRDGTAWDLWGRLLAGGSWGSPQKLSRAGTNTFHRAASSHDGKVFVVWQSSQGAARQGQSDIWMRVWDGSWSDPMQVSDSPANDWEPQVAGGPDGQAHIAWDGYHNGNYDIFYRSFANGVLGEIEQVTSSPRFQAHANVAVGPDGAPWLAWDESGVNWGKDQGYLITPPLGIPLHQERSIAVVRRSAGSWVAPRVALEPFYVYRLYPNFENPQLAFDANGTLTMLFRHWTRQRAHGIGARMMWEDLPDPIRRELVVPAGAPAP